jgi:hypothetical protein
MAPENRRTPKFPIGNDNKEELNDAFYNKLVDRWERDRQRQTDRQTNRETGRDRQKETDREIEREIWVDMIPYI